MLFWLCVSFCERHYGCWSPGWANLYLKKTAIFAGKVRTSLMRCCCRQVGLVVATDRHHRHGVAARHYHHRLRVPKEEARAGSPRVSHFYLFHISVTPAISDSSNQRKMIEPLRLSLLLFERPLSLVYMCKICLSIEFRQAIDEYFPLLPILSNPKRLLIR
jgi:hypothetical protein